MGKVFIVGAGIGGIADLTVRGHKILQQAEVVIYDALVDATLLSLVPQTCQLICVAKRGGQESITQSEINQILVQSCQEHAIVVRLKSGDPMIFGRLVPELITLQDAGYEFEIIPGISSAIAAPMLAGIPLTDVELSPCFTVLTGHDLETLPWQALGQIPTLVILMGTAKLEQLLAKLRIHKAPDTKIALIQWAGRPIQKIWTGTLGDILAKLPQQIAPAVIVVGEVVNYHQRFYHVPRGLTGKRILVTRASEQSSKLRDLLENAGASVMEMPTLVITPPSNWHQLDQAIAQLKTYDWLVLTSANAVNYFFQRLHRYHLDSRSLHQLKIAVVGQKTAEVLHCHGIIADLVPPDFIADSLGQVFPDCNNLHILFPRVESGGREVLISELTAKGATVDAVAAYESKCPERIDESVWRSLQNRQIDILTFGSAKTVKHFYQLVTQVSAPEQLLDILETVQIAAIGPQTALACQEWLGKVDITASEFTLEGLVRALITS